MATVLAKRCEGGCCTKWSAAGEMAPCCVVCGWAVVASRSTRMLHAVESIAASLAKRADQLAVQPAAALPHVYQTTDGFGGRGVFTNRPFGPRKEAPRSAPEGRTI